MRIDKPKRGRKAAKRIDLTDIKEALRDRRQWTALGLIVAPTDGSPHWRIESDDQGNQVDVLVEVVLQPSQEQITARLAAGMWTVPALGEEVAVIIPAGRTDFMPTIVCILSSNSVPGGGQGPDPTTIVIARGSVLIHDGNGGAQALAYKSDVDGVINYIQTGLVLKVPGAQAGTAVLAAGVATSLAPSTTGTQVLKAK